MHFRRNPRSRDDRRGVAALELVIATSTFLFILVASTDFARLFYHYLTITSCARNGALYGCRRAATSTDTAGIQTAALADASSMSPAPGVSSTTGTDSSISGDSYTYVAVTVSYTFNTILSYPGIPSTMNLTRTVRMRVAQGQPN